VKEIEIADTTATNWIKPRAVCSCCGVVGAYDLDDEVLCQICLFRRSAPDILEHECNPGPNG